MQEVIHSLHRSTFPVLCVESTTMKAASARKTGAKHVVDIYYHLIIMPIDVLPDD